MSQGQYVFTQLCSFLPKRIFDCLVDKYEGNKWVKSFTCWHHLLVMVFGQLSNRKSMRDLIVTLNAHRPKFYRLGLGKSVTRSNLSKVNEVREARIFKEYADRLIDIARRKRDGLKEFFCKGQGVRLRLHHHIALPVCILVDKAASQQRWRESPYPI